MRAILLCCSLLSCIASQAQVSSITVRVLNGHNGKPVKRADLILTQGHAQPYTTPLDRRTDIAGRTSVLLQNGTELHAIVLRYPTCRTVKKADRTKPSIGYSTDFIVARGEASENNCGQHKVVPAPGELVLFVRPQHWWERMSY